jgi:glycosyltransferase involved in cell wall biosynthesis
MRITFVLPHAGLSGGIRVIAIYAEKLQQRGHDVFVVSQPLPQPSLKQKIKSWLKGNSDTKPNQSQSHFDGIKVNHKVLETCRPVVDDDVPSADVIIATWWKTAHWVAKLSPEKGKKFYFIQHHETHPYFPIEEVKASYRLPLQKIVIAEWLKKIMAEEYNDRNVNLIMNSVDLNQFYAPQREKPQIPTFGLMYSSKSWKGTDISLQAIEIANQSIPDLKIIAFGAEKIQNDLPLPDNATYYYRPPQEKLREIYSACNGWLFCSRVEGFGLPILEAMACRTPVIATPAGAAPELVGNGEGILLNSYYPKEIAKAIIKFAHLSKKHWLTYSEKSYQTATSYSWDGATNLLETILRQKGKGDFCK